MNDDPKFHSLAAWSNQNLVRFAQDAYLRMNQDFKTIEQLRLDLKDAMEIIRKLNCAAGNAGTSIPDGNRAQGGAND